MEKRDNKAKFMDFDEMKKIIEDGGDGNISEIECADSLEIMSADEEAAIAASNKNYLVAMIDVLGFKNLLATEHIQNICRMFRNLQYRTWHHMQNETLVISKSGALKECHPVHYAFFSDTILIWQDVELQDEDAGEKVDRLLISLQLFMSNSLANIVPLRAGIAWGECILEPTINMFIGRPIADAFILEDAQDWVGAAFHPSAMQLINSIKKYFPLNNLSKYAQDYNVPIKKKVDLHYVPQQALLLINR